MQWKYYITHDPRNLTQYTQNMTHDTLYVRHDKWQIYHLQCLTDSFRRAGEQWPRAGYWMSVRCQLSQKNVRQMSDLLHRCKVDDSHQTYGRKISAKSNRCLTNISNVKNMSVQYHRCQADASDVRQMSVMSGRYQWLQYVLGIENHNYIY